MRYAMIAAIAAGAFSVPAHGQASTSGYGSASIQSVRNCPANATIACDGRGAGQGTVSSRTTGGAGAAVNTSFDVGANGRALAGVAFGGLGLPELKLDAYSGTTTRIANSFYAWQTYTWNGPDEFDILLNANFHIVNSSASPSDGALAGGVIANTGFAIWNKADFFANLSPRATGAQVIAQPLLFGATGTCEYYREEGLAGPRATVSAGRSLSGGANQNIALDQVNCDEETLTIDNGDEFVIAGFAQLITNRDGWADATGTFTIGLDPSMGEAAQRTFASSVVFQTPGAVPEPATWAMMIAGFGFVGAAMRRARRVALAA